MTRTLHRRSILALSLAASLLLGALPARAGDDHFAPDGPNFQVNQYSKYTQGMPAIGADAEGNFVVAWTSLGDIWARMYWADGTPRTDEFYVNPDLTYGDQDRPAIGIDGAGEFVIAWQDWDGNDGYQMGGGARVYNANGTPRTGSFVLNEHWQGSQFDQAIAMRPDGSFVAAWSDSDQDGIAGVFARAFDAFGNPLSGDFLVNDPQSTSQVTPGVACDGAGDFVITWTDASAHYGDPRNVVGRVYGPNLAPLTAEIPLTGSDGSGFQRWPVPAMSQWGSWMAVWQDESATDGSGMGCFGRLFDLLGNPLTPVMQINQSTAGDQSTPRVGADFLGNMLVTWQDRSTGDLDIKARRYDATGAAIGGEFRVNPPSTVDQLLAAAALDWSGERVIATYMGDGDVFAQRYRTRPITTSIDRNPQGDLEVSIDLVLNGNPGFPYQLGFSAGMSPGIALPDGRIWQLNYDTYFQSAVAAPNGPLFFGFLGVLDHSAEAHARIVMRRFLEPEWIGANFFVSAVTFSDGTRPGPFLRTVTSPVRVPVRF